MLGFKEYKLCNWSCGQTAKLEEPPELVEKRERDRGAHAFAVRDRRASAHLQGQR
jgi:hypothetical protein